MTKMTTILATLAVMYTSVVQAQTQRMAPVFCLPMAEAEAILATKHKEAPVAEGLAASGQLMRVFASKGGATWTFTVTDPQSGEMCIIASGTDLYSLRFVMPKQKLNQRDL